MSAATSFRDPGGFCFVWERKILRVVSAAGLTELEAFLASCTATQFVDRGELVSTRKLNATEWEELRQDGRFQELLRERDHAAVFEHERVEFPSYPYEWPPEMLYFFFNSFHFCCFYCCVFAYTCF